MYLRLIAPFIKRACIVQRVTRVQVRTVKTVANNELKDEPIKYSTSEAGKWKAKYTTSGKEYFDQPRIQPLVVVMSLTAFMVYFCVLREENDLDDWLRNIEKDVPLQFEEIEVRSRIEQAKRINKDTSDYEKRLENIMKLRAKIDALK